jgi:hypothetical protein
LGGALLGALGAGSLFFGGNSEQKTLSNVSLDDVQNTYATSVLTNMQNCGAIPAEVNVVDIVGNFNTATNIDQYLSNGSQMQCSFQANNQQAVQDNLVSELAAQAEANATAPLNADALFGLFQLHSGGLLNEANVDVSQVQNAVATVITNQVQNCNSSNCNPECAGSLSPNCSGTQTSGCAGMCAPSAGSPCSSANCGSAYANMVCVDGNFNSVSNITQQLNVDWIKNCMYAESTTQNVTQSLQSQINAVANATTVSTFSAFGWLVYFAVFFVIIGALILAALFGYHVVTASRASGAQQ